MITSSVHKFHIPVLGLAFSIDTPLKVARFGISSVMSIMDDELIEKMRAYYSDKYNQPFIAIEEIENDFRAKRITAYLNLAQQIIAQQIDEMRLLAFEEKNDLTKYFEMLPDDSKLKMEYLEMMEMKDENKKVQLQTELKSKIQAGSIDVNIMAKVDKPNFDKAGNPLPSEFSDALAALRGFANSKLNSSVVFSAGYNPRLYNYVEQFSDFFPDSNGQLKKKIILKVSDFRSAQVQGKIFAKKGIWISEFRIESGLNCGGHAFATDGYLLGPVLEEFKNKRKELTHELFELCCTAQKEKNLFAFEKQPYMQITVQGGIGTANENTFLMEHYQLDGTGWGSPFLLVSEATNVDDETLNSLSSAQQEDYFLSNASPLGISFNNFKKSSSEKLRLERIAKNRSGSPCYKKFLATNTEFTTSPICTGSREYQSNKIKQLEEKNLPPDLFQSEVEQITAKECICEGLGASVLIKDALPLSHNLNAVAICPGPNLAYFSGKFSLQEMVNHIYGHANILNSIHRPNMFINELNLYVDYYKKKIESILIPTPKQEKYLQDFKENLLEGISYYRQLVNFIKTESVQYITAMLSELDNAAVQLATHKLILEIQHN